ncbi:hypothetical protein G6F55_014633 [Rhizopus delemar]|nr:hypothetical protein G6F55_014633 [Rhizopus delemar]
MPGVDPRAFVLLGMCAYLTGVTQAPLTSAVISLELTDSGDLLLPILATVLIARGVAVDGAEDGWRCGCRGARCAILPLA